MAPHLAGSLARLILVLIGAKLFGELADRLGQPAVLGELAAGVLLGTGLVPFFDSADPVLRALAAAGMFLLIAETGLEADRRALLGVSRLSSGVAVVGVLAPLAAGALLMRAARFPWNAAFFTGAALTATSVGLTARVLSDLRARSAREGQILLGAAVIDDVLGLALLALAAGLAAGGRVSWLENARSSGLVLGAFAAGLLLAESGRKRTAARILRPAAVLLVPVFFVMAGARLDLRGLLHDPWWSGPKGLALAAALLAAALAGKAVSGWAAREPGLDRWAIGAGMMPRGEVGLIFAQLGLDGGVLSAGLYAVLVGIVAVSSFLGPLLLRRALRPGRVKPPS